VSSAGRRACWTASRSSPSTGGDVDPGGRVGEPRLEPLDLGRKGRPRLLELGLGGDLLERSALAGQLSVELVERLLGIRVHEQRRRVVEELVAGRSVHRPLAERLAGLEDLLDPDVLGAPVAQPAQVARGEGEPVGVVDAQALDEPFADELEHLA
jgi:hypothetical protein